MMCAIFYMHQISGGCAGMCRGNLTHQLKNTTIVSQRERNALTFFHEKAQINNVKMETFSFHPPACLSAHILVTLTNTILTNLWWQPLTVHICYMTSVYR